MAGRRWSQSAAGEGLGARRSTMRTHRTLRRVAELSILLCAAIVGWWLMSPLVFWAGIARLFPNGSVATIAMEELSAGREKSIPHVRWLLRSNSSQARRRGLTIAIALGPLAAEVDGDIIAALEADGSAESLRLGVIASGSIQTTRLCSYLMSTEEAARLGRTNGVERGELLRLVISALSRYSGNHAAISHLESLREVYGHDPGLLQFLEKALRNVHTTHVMHPASNP